MNKLTRPTPQKSNSNLRLARRGQYKKQSFTLDSDNWPQWLQFVLIQPSDASKLFLWGPRVVILVLMVLFTFPILWKGAEAGIVHFLHNINLPIHETGHIVFGVFQWRWLGSLGGSLFQVIMPLVCTLALLIKTRDLFGASVGLWWTFENFVDLAPYIGDARAGVLPLLGGNTGQTAPYGFHDWQFILGEMGLSHWDKFLSGLAQYLGLFGMVLSICWGAWILIYMKNFSKE